MFVMVDCDWIRLVVIGFAINLIIILTKLTFIDLISFRDNSFHS